MRTPKWFRQALADEGALLLERSTTTAKVRNKLVPRVVADRSLILDIAGDWVDKMIRRWVRTHALPGATDLDDGDQLTLAFPDLPRRLEVAPGRFTDQAVMTGADWDAALRQAQTKAHNASGYAEAIRKAYDQVRPLLTDDQLITAQVWASRPAGDASSAAS